MNSNSALHEAGYVSHAYAAASALASGGSTAPFGASGGHVIVRPIPGSYRNDACGPYPIFTCINWNALDSAVGSVAGQPVTLTLVMDPFCPLRGCDLEDVFDICRRLHEHRLIDLTAPVVPSIHHSRKLRNSGQFSIEMLEADSSFMPEFWSLYRELVVRKRISDLRGFSQEVIAQMLAVPGGRLVIARKCGRLLGADLYYQEGRTLRAHLSAYSNEGYANSVSYTMMAAAIENFRGSVDVMDLGGSPVGGATGGVDGVAFFKSGWTKLTRTSFLCGKVYDHDIYTKLSNGLSIPWFPIYRHGEFST